MIKEKRKHKRIYLLIPAEIKHESQSEIVKVQDVSLGGCRIKSRKIFKVNDVIKISFSMPDQNAEDFHTCDELDAKVLRSDNKNQEIMSSLFFFNGVSKRHCLEEIIKASEK